jgi:hypothetical protein
MHTAVDSQQHIYTSNTRGGLPGTDFGPVDTKGPMTARGGLERKTLLSWQRQVPSGGSTMDPTRLHLNLMEEACIVTQMGHWL